MGDCAPQVVGLGQCSLDFLGTLTEYPEPDQKAELDEVLIQGGGPTATALVTLARLGIETAFMGRTGADDYGSQIMQGLLEEGVDCSGLLQDPKGSSQVAFIVVDGAGRRNIFWHRGTAAPLTAAELDTERVAGALILHLDGLQADAALAAAKVARERGVITVLDGGSWRAGTERLLPLIDHLVVSEKFARQVSAACPAAALRKLAVHGAAAVTVTRGSTGSLTLMKETYYRMPAFPIAAIDTTGCGDVFHGAYIYGLLMRWDLPRTLRFSAACAALKTRAPGGRTAIPSLQEIEAFLAAHPNLQAEVVLG